MTNCHEDSQWEANKRSRDEISANQRPAFQNVLGIKADLVRGTDGEQLHIPSIK